MFRVHSVGQRPNLRHLGEPLGGAKSLLGAVSFKKATEDMSRGRVANAMGASSTQWGLQQSPTLKPREANALRTRGTDSRLVFAERRERVGV